MSQNAFTDFPYIFLNKCFFFCCIPLGSFLDTYFPIIFSSLRRDWVHGASHVAMLPAELPRSFYTLFLIPYICHPPDSSPPRWVKSKLLIWTEVNGGDQIYGAAIGQRKVAIQGHVRLSLKLTSCKPWVIQISSPEERMQPEEQDRPTRLEGWAWRGAPRWHWALWGSL